MRPQVYLICGHIGVGKTTAAKMLGELTGAPIASVDDVIHRLFERPSNMGEDAIFSEAELDVCYRAFALITERLLSAGSSVIIDGAFARKKQRRLVLSVAEHLKAPSHVLYLTCPERTMRERCEKRFASGEGVGWNANRQLKKKYEPLDGPCTIIDTSKDVKAQLNKFLRECSVDTAE